MQDCYKVTIKLYARDGRKIDHADITLPPGTTEAEAYAHAAELTETSRVFTTRLAAEQEAQTK